MFRKILTVASVLVFLATCALWVRAAKWEDTLNTRTTDHRWRVRTFPRSLELMEASSDMVFVCPSAASVKRTMWSYPAEFHLFDSDLVYRRKESTASVGGRNSLRGLGFEWESWDSSYYRLEVPYWALLLLTGAFPLLGFLRSARGAVRRARRLGAGLCTSCGYDVRACSTRCSECGKEIPAFPKAG